MKISFAKDFCIISDLYEFDPKDIFTCGQAFRWFEESDRSFTFVTNGKVANVKKINEEIVLRGVDKASFYQIFYNYFDLDRNYKEIIDELSRDEIMKNATEYGKGIRILNQEKFETIISFIISANNQIPRIKKSIEKISQMYGDFISEDENRKYFSFPSADRLKEAKAEDLREFARVGFRDKRIVETAKLIDSGEVNISEIEKISMVNSLSISDAEDPRKIYCRNVKRNPEGQKRSMFNADKAKFLRKSLFEHFKDDKSVSFCFSIYPEKENDDAEILKKFAINN